MARTAAASVGVDRVAVGGFTVESLRAEEEEGLPYRRTRTVPPEDSDAYFGTERIVRVVVCDNCPLGARIYPDASFFFSCAEA